MAIHFQEEEEMQGGSLKIINASAQRMMLDLVQKYQYQYPIRSTVRELASNALDSISDREVARKILVEGRPVSDFFIEKEGEEFQDSKFDAGYYDFNWLGDDNSVLIHYITGTGFERDKVIISDNGTGLGGSRLEKYFELGYSTKRLSKLPLGKFGIGGKAALSMGEPFYTMETRYNGQKFRFNVYSHKFDSLIPQFDLEKNVENEYVVFYAGTDREMKVYYENTELKNGVTVTVAAKKTHKQQFIDAVKSQLLYFQNINFLVTDESGIRDIPYKANIIYEDDKIILSNNSYWSKPHLIINGVNYGYINFEELEIEDKRGNIGIKISSEDVDINPSRESIIWNEVTKKTVLERFNEVVEIAQNLLQTEFKTNDYLDWLRTCYQVISKTAEHDGIVNRLAKIVDLSNVKPIFEPEPKLKFQLTKVFDGLYVRVFSVEEIELKDVLRKQVIRNTIKNMKHYIHMPIYLMRNGEKSSFRKDKYISSLNTDGSFVVVMEPLTSKEQMLQNGFKESDVEAMLAYFNREGSDSRDQITLAWEHLKNSKDIHWYDEVEVPEDFKGTDEEKVEVDLSELREMKRQEKLEQDRLRRKMTQQQRQQEAKSINDANVKRRKAEGKILIYTPRANDSQKSVEDGKKVSLYTWQKMEIPIQDMNNWEAEEIYYSTGPEMDKYAHFAAFISRDPSEYNKPFDPIRDKSIISYSNKSISYSVSEWIRNSKWFESYGNRIANYQVDREDALKCQNFFDTEVMILKVSKVNLDYMGDFLPLQSFFRQIRNNIITMSSTLVKWNTARQVKEKLNKAHFLFNYKFINPYYANLYKELCNYVDSNYREVANYRSEKYLGIDDEMYDDLIKLLDQVQYLQEFVASRATTEEIAQVTKAYFGDTSIKDGYAVDMDVLDKIAKVIDYAEAVGPLFNYIPILTGGIEANKNYSKGMYRTSLSLPTKLEAELISFLDFKGLLDYGKDEQDFQEFQKNIQSKTVLVEEASELSEDRYLSIEESSEIQGNISTDLVSPERAGLTSNDNLEIPGDKSIIQSF